MTREDQLYAMNGATLIMLADKLKVKVSCNKTRTALKEAKQNVIERILAAENIKSETPAETDNWEDNSYEEKQKKAAESDKIAENAINKKEKKSPDTAKKSTGRNAQLEFDGRSQNICAWAKELGISANTLYGRIYKMGWSIEKAFTTPARPLKKSET